MNIQLPTIGITDGLRYAIALQLDTQLWPHIEHAPRLASEAESLAWIETVIEAAAQHDLAEYQRLTLEAFDRKVHP